MNTDNSVIVTEPASTRMPTVVFLLRAGDEAPTTNKRTDTARAIKLGGNITQII